MFALPQPVKVAGPHQPIYEAYYKEVLPDAEGNISAMNAARFLKRSNLSDTILSKIWDMSDPQSRGFLDKSGMFVALKLCALVQQGYNLNMSNIYLNIGPPIMDGKGNYAAVANAQKDWSINAKERLKYEQLFESLLPIDGYIPGNKVKGVLMDSKLPVETLGKIWDLADMDKDGKLDKYEFMIAMHLVYKALENYAIPTVLPPELIQIKNTADVAPKIPNIKPPALRKPSLVDAPEIKQDWIVPIEDQTLSEKLFIQADKDMDGFLSGLEAKDVFVQSGLSQQLLAHIWNLCDISRNGKLNKEQFALSMWLIKFKLKGNELPTVLTKEMIPPSFRDKSADAVQETNKVEEYSNPELKMINDDIIDLLKEKRLLEQDISQKESDITIKTGEIKSLQNELDTLAATLRQLENQKGEAKKRLNDLKAQVQKLHQQADEHEATLNIQTEELNAKRQELECLKQEEQLLELQQNKVKDCLNDLTNVLQNIQLQISQTKATIIHLEEQHHQMFDAITQYDAALAAGDAFVVPDSTLVFQTDIQEILNDGKSSKEPEIKENKDSGNNNNSVFPNQDRFESAFNKNEDSFQTETDLFGDDPFAALHAPPPRSVSPSPALPPKKAKQPPPRPAPPKTSAFQDESDPFASKADPFTSKVDPFASKSDPFAAKPDQNKNSGFADFANFDSQPVMGSQLDFVDDPFKDYRYDDISKISDPFNDGAH